jgi:hypothetical protein
MEPRTNPQDTEGLDATICLACGVDLAPGLAFLAVVRCHDCEADRMPIHAALVRRARGEAPLLRLISSSARPVAGRPVAA